MGFSFILEIVLSLIIGFPFFTLFGAALLVRHNVENYPKEYANVVLSNMYNAMFVPAKLVLWVFCSFILVPFFILTWPIILLGHLCSAGN